MRPGNQTVGVSYAKACFERIGGECARHRQRGFSADDHYTGCACAPERSDDEHSSSRVISSLDPLRRRSATLESWRDSGKASPTSFSSRFPQNGIGSGSITTSVNFADFRGVDGSRHYIGGRKRARRHSNAIDGFRDPTNPRRTPVSCPIAGLEPAAPRRLSSGTTCRSSSGALNTITVTGIAPWLTVPTVAVYLHVQPGAGS